MTMHIKVIHLCDTEKYTLLFVESRYLLFIFCVIFFVATVVALENAAAKATAKATYTVQAWVYYAVRLINLVIFFSN